MNSLILVLPFLAIVCCVGLPLRFGGAVGIVISIVIAAAVGAYASTKRRTAVTSGLKNSDVT